MPDFEPDGDERLLQEAEELMRQRRFHDAALRYLDLRRRAPGDLWANLGHASALECAGLIEEAERVLEEAAVRHRGSAAVQRFRHLFFVRRENVRAAAACRTELGLGVRDDGPDDQLAELYFNQGRYVEALSELERLLAGGVEDGEQLASVLARCGACLRQQGELERARGRLLEALAADPGNHWTLSELAETERALGERDAARRHYLEALEAQPDDHWTRGHLAQLEAESGDPAAAERLYEEILRAEPRAAWARVELAQLLAERDPGRSAALCREVVDADPRNPWANAQLAQLARRDGRPEEARTLYLQALTGAPDAAWLLHELAETCRQLGRLPEAYAHLDRAEASDPYNATTFGYRADLLRGEGRAVEARTNLEKAVDIDPDYAWAWRELAELRALAGEHAAAEVAWRRASAAEPDAAANDGLRAFLLRCQGRRDAALPWLERAVERQADYLWAWRELAELHLAAARPADAEAAVRRALERHAEAPALWGLLAEALRRQGRRDEAVVAVERALAGDGEEPQLWAIRAELHAERGDPGAAVAAARRTVELDDAPEYRLLLAQALAAGGGSGEARALLADLLAGANPPAPAWELAAALAEREDDFATATSVAVAALAGPLAGDPRLLLRRLHLAAETGGDVSAADLDAVLAAGQRPDLAWSEVARLALRAGSPARARRAAHLQLEHAGEAGCARAWVGVAEVELALGDRAAAADALAQALAVDPDVLQGLVLQAVLAEQRGDAGAAVAALRRAVGLPGDEAAEARPALLRQLALLLERRGDPEGAGIVWDELCAQPGASPGILAERAAWHWRRGALAAGRSGMDAAAAAGCGAASDEWQHLLRDAAVALAAANGPADGLAELEAHAAELAPPQRLLAARLALAAGDPAAARRHAQAAGDGREAALVLVRARLAGWDPHAGDGEARARAAGHVSGAVRAAARALLSGRDPRAVEAEVRALAAAEPGDEEAAVLLAESLALSGRHAEALAAIEHPSLPGRPNPERGLLLAVLVLELHGPVAAAARLALLERPDHDIPLVRLLAAAWPGQPLAVDPQRPVRADDILRLPPFPRMAERLAVALRGQGRHHLAADLLAAVAGALDGAVRRRLLALAAAAYRAAGSRRRAWRCAWLSRDPRAWFAVLL